MIYLLALLIPFVSFILQSYPRLFNKLFGVDVWTRLLEIDHIRKNHHHIPQKKLTGQFIIDGYFDYPPIFPTLLSYIPKNALLSMQGFIAPCIDALQVLLVYFVALYLTHNVYLALLAQGMYMLTPMIAIENSYLTPRSLGYLNFSLATLPLLLYYYQGGAWFYIGGIIFTTLLFLTHRFAIQSFLFITLFFSFFLNTGIFIQSFVLGFAFALLITKGYYLRVVKGHLYNIYFWIKNLDHRFSHQVRGRITQETKTDFVNRIYTLLSVFSPVAIFGLNPWALSGFIIAYIAYFHLLALPPIFIGFAAWILFFYFLGVVVLKTKYLMPIGEGQRYMEMATVPAAILSSYLFFAWFMTPAKTLTLGILIALLLLNLCMILFIQIKGVIKDKNRSVTGDLMNVFKFINKQKNTVRIICIPHQNTTMTIYHTKAQVFVNADNPGLMRVQEVYPILKMSLKELAKKYNLTHALVKESFVSLRELQLSPKNIVFQSEDVKLVKLQ
jgi:hypothetical protein